MSSKNCVYIEDSAYPCVRFYQHMQLLASSSPVKCNNNWRL